MGTALHTHSGSSVFTARHNHSIQLSRQLYIPTAGIISCSTLQGAHDVAIFALLHCVPVPLQQAEAPDIAACPTVGMLCSPVSTVTVQVCLST